mgnify:CR=1 FL=1
MVSIQLSLFGKMSAELLYQEIGWILEPSSNLSVAPKFQCLNLNGQMREWCEGENLSFVGEYWMPNISESLSSSKEEREYLLYSILEDFVPTKYYISPKTCSNILKRSEMSKIRIPSPIEEILIRQGGRYQTSDPFKTDKCGKGQKEKMKPSLGAVSENQMNLFQLY